MFTFLSAIATTVTKSLSHNPKFHLTSFRCFAKFLVASNAILESAYLEHYKKFVLLINIYQKAAFTIHSVYIVKIWTFLTDFDM